MQEAAQSPIAATLSQDPQVEATAADVVTAAAAASGAYWATAPTVSSLGPMSSVLAELCATNSAHASYTTSCRLTAALSRLQCSWNSSHAGSGSLWKPSYPRLVASHARLWFNMTSQ